ncbi:MAG: PIN domain-containing protein [Candidatus Omnitrophica bacterium]|nr:PIN domain-containing protein [Candidatus Omnitrophota bacterium]
MKIPRVYIDTSVIGGCFDIEFEHWSKRLFQEFHEYKKVAVISDLTLEELELAPESVRALVGKIPQSSCEKVSFSDDAEALAKEYIRHKVVTNKHLADAQHIAIATLERVDVLVSWNFKQIVNLNRIHLFNSVNLKFGFSVLEIRSPREVLNEKEI